MPRFCPACRERMTATYVESTRSGPRNRPTLYRNVRRYECPNGCRPILDFQGAGRAADGVRPIVVARRERATPTSEFNDRLLIAGMAGSLLLALLSLMAIPMPLSHKALAALGVVAAVGALHRFTQTRVILPSYFPVPKPVDESIPEEQESARKPVRPVAPSPSTTESKKMEVPAGPVEIPKLERAPGEPITMKVHLSGEEHVLEVNEDENMLDAALDRDVGLDFSCREGLCDTCLVRVLAGAENINDPTPEEIDMLGDDVKKGMRLSCQVKVRGPVVIQQE